MAAPECTQVFVSYNHNDAEWLKRLQVMLRPLTRNQIIDLWDDTRIEAGSKWREEIKRALASARVAVLLVSSDFLGSEFIADNELPPLLKAAEEEGLKILWVAVGASLYQETVIADFQATNNPAKPLKSLEPWQVDDELVKIAKQIKAAVSQPITSGQQGSPGSPPRTRLSEMEPSSWRAELVSKGWRKRTIKLYQNNHQYVLEYRHSLWADDVLSVNGTTVKSFPEAITDQRFESLFELDDGTQGSVEGYITLADRITDFRVHIAGRLLYSEDT